VIDISLVPIPLRIAALVHERKSLLEYPIEQLAGIIRDVRFRCTCCGKCCTRAFNGHVFLLDRDVASVREIAPEAIEPAPDPEFCDQYGTFYVSGYALRAKDDAAGSCWFLENGRCRIYDNRFSICRIYPYMLHREPDEAGTVDWRQISGIDLHGEYDREISEDEALEIARETKEFENAFLDQEIAFLEHIREYFSKNRLRHVQKIYDDRMRAFAKGSPVRVMVFCDGGLEEHTLHLREM
jgi:Fe-S-cluster containining protein